MIMLYTYDIYIYIYTYNIHMLNDRLLYDIITCYLKLAMHICQYITHLSPNILLKNV